MMNGNESVEQVNNRTDNPRITRRYLLAIRKFIVKRQTTTTAGIVFGALLAFVLGYRTRQIGGRIGQLLPQQRQPILLQSLVVVLFAREFWRLIPLWLQKQIIRRIPFRRSNDGTSTAEDADDDNDDLTSIGNLQKKLSAVWDVIEQKTSTSPSSATGTDDSGDVKKAEYDMLYFSVFLWKVALMKQLKESSPELRDERYGKSGTVCKDPTTVLKGMDDEFEYADWAYDELPNEQTLKDALLAKNYVLLRHDKNTIPGSVAHYIAMDASQKQILIGVKGTSSFEDMLTDLCGQAVSYPLREPLTMKNNIGSGGIADSSATKSTVTIDEVRCHEGIILAARRLTDDLVPLVKEFFIPQGYKIRIVGHSLGAGVAALCGLLLISQFPKELLSKAKYDGRGDSAINVPSYTQKQRLEVLAFASPPILDYETALACKQFCTTVVNNSDIIPRASVSNLVVTMNLVRAFQERMKEKGFENPTKDWATVIRLWQSMTNPTKKDNNIDKSNKKKHGNESASTDSHSEEPIFSGIEFEEELDKAQKSVPLSDPDHLYCPGNVLLLYDYWDKQNPNVEEDGERQQKDGFADEDKSVEKATDDDDGNAMERTAEGLVLTDGTNKELRWFEMDDRMFGDHLSPGYRSSIKSLLTPKEQ